MSFHIDNVVPYISENGRFYEEQSLKWGKFSVTMAVVATVAGLFAGGIIPGGEIISSSIISGGTGALCLYAAYKCLGDFLEYKRNLPALETEEEPYLIKIRIPQLGGQSKTLDLVRTCGCRYDHLDEDNRLKSMTKEYHDKLRENQDPAAEKYTISSHGGPTTVYPTNDGRYYCMIGESIWVMTRHKLGEYLENRKKGPGLA